MSNEDSLRSDTTYEPSLLERVQANPRPAAIWAGVALVLVVLEFGRLVRGFLSIGNGLRYLLDLLVIVPGWIGGNVAGTLGLNAGNVAQAVTGLLMVVVAAAILRRLLPLGDRLASSTADPRRRFAREVTIIAVGLAVAVALVVFTPVGGLVRGGVTSIRLAFEAVGSLPTLTSPRVIPNIGYRSPSGGWEGTFLNLSPRAAWAVRFSVVWIYAFTWVAWLWKGYNIFREHYREADWTPRDDVIKRLRHHTWGMFGLFIVLSFVILAAFAPAISPTPIDHNVYEPYNHEFQYLTDDGEVETVLHGTANLQSRSDGQNTIGINSYDDYDRYAPLGTTPRGQDLLTNLAYGARTSLVIALTVILIGGLLAITLSLMTAYYKGILDIAVILASDTIISIPVLVLAMMIVVVFKEGGHPLAAPLDGGLLLAVVLGIAYWPSMWRAIRGPSLQVAEEEWVDAARSYGQSPSNIMRKHMAPYVASYIIIYGSLLIGGVIITVAALSFLGLGIHHPTPEWGRLINEGRPYIPTSSWHVSTVSGIMIALVVLAFNALGDAVRDAIDPEADVGTGAEAGGGA